MLHNILGWRVWGYSFRVGDCFYDEIAKAIETENVTQEYLQNTLKYPAPILVDSSKKTIEFCRW